MDERKLPLNVAIPVFDDVEILDFCGPFEVFSVANRYAGEETFHVFTVAENATITARGGLTVERHHSLNSSPSPDVLVVPGGVGVRAILDDSQILDWIAEQAKKSHLVTSVCTGALLLGRCGLLDGLRATTHHQCIEELRKIAPQSEIVEDRRFVDTGRVITSAGISAGIDMSLHIVSRLIGPDTAHGIATNMEYEYKSEKTKICDDS